MSAKWTLRTALLTGLGVSVLTLAMSAYFYPGLRDMRGAVRPLTGLCVGLVWYTCAAVYRTDPTSPEDATVLRQGVTWGLLLGCLWIVQTTFENIVVPHSVGAPVGVLLGIAALCLPFAAGAVSAIKGGRVRIGMRVGFWSGFVSGLIAFFALAAVGYILAFIPGLPGAEIPSAAVFTATEFQELNVSDALGGALSHLFLLGGVWSTVAGAAGGAAGIALASTGR